MFRELSTYRRNRNIVCHLKFGGGIPSARDLPIGAAGAYQCLADGRRPPLISGPRASPNSINRRPLTHLTSLFQ